MNEQIKPSSDKVTNNMRKNQRVLVSVLMLFGFAAILVTGLMSYIMRYSPLLSAVHTFFGLLFVIYGVFHLRNNLRPMIQYFKGSVGKKWALFSIGIICSTVMGMFLGLPPFKTVTDVGYAIKELKPIDRQLVQTLYTRFEEQGKGLTIEVKAGDHYSGPGASVLGVRLTGVPQMAIWIEDSKGNYIETLYVTKASSNGSYSAGIFSTEEVRRPEALPHWAFSRGVRSDDGSMMPSTAQPLADAITGATPLSSFDLKTKTTMLKGDVVVKLEINRSYDFNGHYHKQAFPDDLIYSGDGSSAQPALVYATTVNFDDETQHYFMHLLGHSHHSGQNGELYTDLSGFTTAKEMVKRVIVEVN